MDGQSGVEKLKTAPLTAKPAAIMYKVPSAYMSVCTNIIYILTNTRET